MAQSGFQGTYEVTAKSLASVVAGQWYYGLDCLVCDKRFAIFDDRSGGKTRVFFGGDRHIRVSCPHCSADRLYGTDQVKHFPEPTG